LDGSSGAPPHGLEQLGLTLRLISAGSTLLRRLKKLGVAARDLHCWFGAFCINAHLAAA